MAKPVDQWFNDFVIDPIKQSYTEIIAELGEQKHTENHRLFKTSGVIDGLPGADMESLELWSYLELRKHFRAINDFEIIPVDDITEVKVQTNVGSTSRIEELGGVLSPRLVDVNPSAEFKQHLQNFTQVTDLLYYDKSSFPWALERKHLIIRQLGLNGTKDEKIKDMLTTACDSLADTLSAARYLFGNKDILANSPSIPTIYDAKLCARTRVIYTILKDSVVHEIFSGHSNLTAYAERFFSDCFRPVIPRLSSEQSSSLIEVVEREFIRIGSGMFGKVHRGSIERTNNWGLDEGIYAFKIASSDVLFSSLGEASCLLALQYPNIVKLHAFGVAANGKSVLVLECVEGGTLEKKILDKVLSLKSTINILRCIAYALHFIHTELDAPRIVYGDFKPDNILIDEKDNAIICDFGTYVSEGSSYAASTTYGKMTLRDDGRLMFERKADPACDIYALGALIMVMFADWGKKPTLGVVLEHKKQNLWNENLLCGRYECPKHIASQMLDIAYQCLVENKTVHAYQLADKLQRIVLEMERLEMEVPSDGAGPSSKC